MEAACGTHLRGLGPLPRVQGGGLSGPSGLFLTFWLPSAARSRSSPSPAAVRTPNDSWDCRAGGVPPAHRPGASGPAYGTFKPLRGTAGAAPATTAVPPASPLEGASGRHRASICRGSDSGVVWAAAAAPPTASARAVAAAAASSRGATGGGGGSSTSSSTSSRARHLGSPPPSPGADKESTNTAQGGGGAVAQGAPLQRVAAAAPASRAALLRPGWSPALRAATGRGRGRGRGPGRGRGRGEGSAMVEAQWGARGQPQGSRAAAAGLPLPLALLPTDPWRSQPQPQPPVRPSPAADGPTQEEDWDWAGDGEGADEQTGGQDWGGEDHVDAGAHSSGAATSSSSGGGTAESPWAVADSGWLAERRPLRPLRALPQRPPTAPGLEQAALQRLQQEWAGGAGGGGSSRALQAGGGAEAEREEQQLLQQVVAAASPEVWWEGWACVGLSKAGSWRVRGGPWDGVGGGRAATAGDGIRADPGPGWLQAGASSWDCY